MYAESVYMAGKAIVRAGTLDRQGEVEDVIMQIWCSNRNEWVEKMWGNEVGKFDGFPPMGEVKEKAEKQGGW